MQKSLVLHMGKMNCGGCTRNITRTLQTLPGITVTGTDLASKTVLLSCERADVTVETIKTTLAEARYPVVEVREGVEAPDGMC